MYTLTQSGSERKESEHFDAEKKDHVGKTLPCWRRWCRSGKMWSWHKVLLQCRESGSYSGPEVHQIHNKLHWLPRQTHPVDLNQQYYFLRKHFFRRAVHFLSRFPCSEQIPDLESVCCCDDRCVLALILCHCTCTRVCGPRRLVQCWRDCTVFQPNTTARKYASGKCRTLPLPPLLCPVPFCRHLDWKQKNRILKFEEAKKSQNNCYHVRVFRTMALGKCKKVVIFLSQVKSLRISNLTNVISEYKNSVAFYIDGEGAQWQTA